jgi:hypothetical protein
MVVVDLIDKHLIKHYQWMVSTDGYIVRRQDRYPLHKLICAQYEDLTNKMIIHVNGNRSDNRRCNLEIVPYIVPYPMIGEQPFSLFCTKNYY